MLKREHGGHAVPPMSSSWTCQGSPSTGPWFPPAATQLNVYSWNLCQGDPCPRVAAPFTTCGKGMMLDVHLSPITASCPSKQVRLAAKY